MKKPLHEHDWRALQVAGARALDIRNEALSAHCADYGGASPAVRAEDLTVDVQRLMECAAHVAATGDALSWEAASMHCEFVALTGELRLSVWGNMSLTTESTDPTEFITTMTAWALEGVKAIRRTRQEWPEELLRPGRPPVGRELSRIFDTTSKQPHPLTGAIVALYDSAALGAAMGDAVAQRVAEHARWMLGELNPIETREPFDARRAGLQRGNAGWRAHEGDGLRAFVLEHARPEAGPEERAGVAFLRAAVRIGWGRGTDYLRAIARREEALAGNPFAKAHPTWQEEARDAEGAHVAALEECWRRERKPRPGPKGEPVRRAATVAIEVLWHDPKPFFNALDKRASDASEAAKRKRAKRRAKRRSDRNA